MYLETNAQNINTDKNSQQHYLSYSASLNNGSRYPTYEVYLQPPRTLSPIPGLHGLSPLSDLIPSSLQQVTSSLFHEVVLAAPLRTVTDVINFVTEKKNK